MGQWTKHFADGTSYTGTDAAVSLKQASWQNSRNSDIVAAELQHGSSTVKIQGVGEFWQSDTYNTVFPGPEVSITKRRVEKKIDSSDTFFKYSDQNGLHLVSFNVDIPNSKWFKIPKAWHNKWFILEYDLVLNKVHYYIKDNKI